MRSLRLSALLEHEGRLPVDEAASLAWRLLDVAPARASIGALSPAGVMLQSDGQVGVLSVTGQRSYLSTATTFERALCGGASAWRPPDETGSIRLFSDEGHYDFAVAALLFACLTGERPFDTAPAVGAPGAVHLSAISSRLASVAPPSLARVLRNELLWHLEPAAGARHWLKRSLGRDAFKTSLLQVLGESGPRDPLALLALRVEALATRQPPRVATLTASVRSGDEAARLVLADAYEERGQPDEAEWLRLESLFQHGIRDAARERSVVSRLTELRTKLPAHFLAEVSRPAFSGCPVRFGLRCSRRWDDLERTAEVARRYCSTCDTSVQFVIDREAAREAARTGQCVAVAPHFEVSTAFVEMGMPIVEFSDGDESAW